MTSGSTLATARRRGGAAHHGAVRRKNRHGPPGSSGGAPRARRHRTSRPRRNPIRSGSTKQLPQATDEPGCHSTSPRPPSLAARARMKSRSLSRLRYPRACGFTGTLLRQTDRVPLGPPAGGAGHVQRGGRGRAAGQHEALQRRERVAVVVAGGFQRDHVLGCDAQPALAVTALGIERHRQIGAQVEQIVLDAAQQVGHLGVRARRRSPRRWRRRSRPPSRTPIPADRPWTPARRRRARSGRHRRRGCRSCRGVPRRAAYPIHPIGSSPPERRADHSSAAYRRPAAAPSRRAPDGCAAARPAAPTPPDPAAPPAASPARSPTRATARPGDLAQPPIRQLRAHRDLRHDGQTEAGLHAALDRLQAERLEPAGRLHLVRRSADWSSSRRLIVPWSRITST